MVFAVLIVLSAVAIFSVHVWKLHAFTLDDAFISFRYAENLARGDGLVFNTGEHPRSEGITSPLWAVLLSPLSRLSVDLVLASKVYGVLFTLATGLTLFLLVKTVLSPTHGDTHTDHRWTANGAWTIGALAVLAFLCDPTTAGHAISGMETALGTFALTVFLLWLTRLDMPGHQRARGMATGLAAVGAALTRPELTVGIVTAYIAALLLYRERRNSILLSIGVFVVLGVLYFGWRWSYYDMLWPLPFYIKQVGHGPFVGWAKVRSFLWTWEFVWPWLPLLLVGLIRSGPYRRTLAVITALFAVQTTYYVSLLHVMGLGLRFLQPLVPVVITLVAVTTGLFLTFLSSRRRARWFILIPALLTAMLIYNRLHKLDNAEHVYLGWYWNRVMVQIVAVGEALQELDPAGNRHIALTDCGAIPYYSRWRVTDLAGLNNRRIAPGYSPETVWAEFERARPDVLFLKSGSDQSYVDGFDGEELVFERAEQLGYRQLGTIRIADDYFYWVYVVRHDAHMDLQDALRAKCAWIPAVSG